MGLAGARLTAKLFPGQSKLGIEFGIVARVCLPDWIRDGELVRPARPQRAISIRRIGLSLGASLETTRRHVGVLVELGAVVSGPAGVQLAASAENEALVRGYYLGNHDLFVALAESVADTCDVEMIVGPCRCFDLKDVIERALDTLLLPVDTFRPAGWNLTAFLHWAALTAAAVRNVTFDPVLSRRFANSIPPDSLRSSLSLRNLADAFEMPYSTVWRHVQALERNHFVTRVGSDRWTVLTRNLLESTVVDLGTSPSTLLYNKLRELALAGFDARKAEGHFRIGRPAIVDLGTSRSG